MQCVEFVKSASCLRIFETVCSHGLQISLEDSDDEATAPASAAVSEDEDEEEHDEGKDHDSLINWVQCDNPQCQVRWMSNIHTMIHSLLSRAPTTEPRCDAFFDLIISVGCSQSPRNGANYLAENPFRTSLQSGFAISIPTHST